MIYTVWFKHKNEEGLIDFSTFSFTSAKKAEDCLELGIRLGMYGWIMVKNEENIWKVYVRENV